MFAPCINSIKITFIVPTDAHYYKIIEMLKHFKIITLALTCFGSHRNHHQGAVLCLAKTTNYGFSVLVGIDAVNVMAVYQPVVQACGSQWRQELLHDDGSCVNRNMSEQVL
jgi:hypothetical protein